MLLRVAGMSIVLTNWSICWHSVGEHSGLVKKLGFEYELLKGRVKFLLSATALPEG